MMDFKEIEKNLRSKCKVDNNSGVGKLANVFLDIAIDVSVKALKEYYEQMQHLQNKYPTDQQ